MTSVKRGWHEDFTRFFEQPTRETLRSLLQFPVGESARLDFKLKWPAFPRLARHVLGMGNAGSGCLVIGVEEKDDGTLETVGLEKPTDEADVRKGILRFVPSELKYDVLTFAYEASEYPSLVGKTFQVVLVDGLPQYLPLMSKVSSGDDIRASTVYVRRGSATEEANYEELQELLNLRVETGYSSRREVGLKEHLADLKTLYGEVPRFYAMSSVFAGLVGAINTVLSSQPNPNYPQEDYESFVARMIEAKRRLIEHIVLQP